MHQFSKLVTSTPINLKLLNRSNFPSSAALLYNFQNCNYSQNKKFKKFRSKQKKMNDVGYNFAAECGNDEATLKNANYNSFRKWTVVNNNVKPDIESSFRIMSYNILAQDLLETHSYLYENNVQKCLDWNVRLRNLLNEIKVLQPHILCLQEVQVDHLDMILKGLNELEFDFECIYKKKTGFGTDGCAILYNKNMFKLLKKHTIEYFQSVECLDRENIAIAAHLQLKDNECSSLLVVTTHLLYNPRRQDVRLAQVQLLLAEIDRYSFNGYSKTNEILRIPIILTGDFNFKPFSAPHKLLNMGYLRYENLTKKTLELGDNNLNGKAFLPNNLGITDTCQHIDLIFNKYLGESRLKNSDNSSDAQKSKTDTKCVNIDDNLNLFSTGELCHSLNLKSVYKHITLNGLPEGSTNQFEWITVDYIFYSQNIYPKINSEKKLKLISYHLLPSTKECDIMGNIPNHYLGSDHLSLTAEFTLSS